MKVNKEAKIGIILFLLPALILFIAFFLFPVFYVGVMSLFDWNGISNATFAGVENYKDIFSDRVFWTSIRNNIIWAVAHVCLQVPMALMMALILSKKPKFWKFF